MQQRHPHTVAVASNLSCASAGPRARRAGGREPVTTSRSVGSGPVAVFARLRLRGCCRCVDRVAGVHRLTLQEARRIAVRAQLLDAIEPIGLVQLVEHLGLLQLDPR
jgi:hypothetical protein